MSDIWPFSHFLALRKKKLIVEKIKRPYFVHFDPKWKNRTSLLSLTLKVGENKVSLFFSFGLNVRNMAIIIFQLFYFYF